MVPVNRDLETSWWSPGASTPNNILGCKGTRKSRGVEEVLLLQKQRRIYQEWDGDALPEIVKGKKERSEGFPLW